MKYRTGFISNSSVSSFICDVCGETVAERDLCLSDAEMFQCKTGHFSCISHMINTDKYDEYCEQEDNEGLYEVPIECCPICQMKSICIDDVDNYLLQISPFKNRDEVKTTMKAQFKTYDELSDFMKSK